MIQYYSLMLYNMYTCYIFYYYSLIVSKYGEDEIDDIIRNLLKNRVSILTVI